MIDIIDIFNKVIANIVANLGGAPGDSLISTIITFNFVEYFKDVFDGNLFNPFYIMLGTVAFGLIYVASRDNHTKNAFADFFRVFYTGPDGLPPGFFKIGRNQVGSGVHKSAPDALVCHFVYLTQEFFFFELPVPEPKGQGRVFFLGEVKK
jgi:hypothetical protein